MKWIWTMVVLFLISGVSVGQSVADLERRLAEAGTIEEQMAINYELGNAHRSGNTDKALEYARRAHQQAVNLEKMGMAAQAAFLTALIYERKRDDRNTEVWLKSALQYAKEAGDSDLIIKSVDKRSQLATKDRNYRRAYEINREAFDYFSKSGTSISDLEQKYAMQKTQIEKEKRQLEQERSQLEQDVYGLLQERDRLTTYKTQLEARQEDLIEEKQEVELKVYQKQEELAVVSEEKAQAEQVARKAEIIAQTKEEEVKQLSREALEQKAMLAEAQLEVARHRNFLAISFMAASFLVILALLLYNRYRASRRAKRELEAKNRIIDSERERSEELLLNILPASIALELKEKGQARARRFDEVTVLFADFKNFTRISEELSPEELVEELDNCFRAFDAIVGSYPDIEKIKTIGDAYMCACGLSERKTMPTNLIRAALEMQEFLEEEKLQRRRQGKPFFEARIGVHTGPVVAGVVGARKFAYDIWGDTVNIAARMEANSMEGKVNISQTTYDLIRYFFRCEHRGKVEAKNKGAIDMYYVQQAMDPVPA